MESPCSHNGNKVLLVEGKNDCHVILALCKHFHIPQNFGIFQCGNDIGVIQRADALLLRADMECIGIVMDADEKTAADFRWNQIRNGMDVSGYPVTDNPDPTGTIWTSSERPTLGIWIMPDNRLRGRIEDFLMEMAPSEALEQARQCVSTAHANNMTTFKNSHRSKADLHTYLAWQDEPGTPMGLAITRQALNPDTQTAREFVNWLTRLFDQ
ncbi:MAG: hypothetical protein HQL65_08390 [Magnetococcales bacterium]|nr:hypothetical protein [Magnetococcales bacterium]